MSHTLYQLKRQAVRLFPPTDFPPVPKSSRRYLQRAWLNSVTLLGDKWLYLKMKEAK